MKQRYFLETDRDSLLFDLVFCDEDPVLAGNIKRSGIDMSKADALVISHLHPDHIGGFNAFKQNRIPLPEGCRQLRAYPAIREQAMLAQVKGKGIVVITGCGHPTIKMILEMTRRLTDTPVYAVVGGAPSAGDGQSSEKIGPPGTDDLGDG